MLYREEILDYDEIDKTPLKIDDSQLEIKSYLSKLINIIKQQSDLINQLNLVMDPEEIFDKLYRNNYVLFGIARILNIHKLNHLFEILNFIFDLARKTGTIKEHSTDYLIKLLYEKALIMLNEINISNSISMDITDLIEESKNYLLPPLRKWNENYNNILNLSTLPTTNEPEKERIDEVFNEEEKLEKKSNKLSVLDIPFDDEPEALNFPMDKIGFISDFYEENTEILENFGNSLLELETSSESSEIINNLFRMIHTVKGGARLLNIKKLEFLTHHLENLLDLLRHGKIELNSNIVDLFLDCKSSLSEILEETASRGPIITRIRPLVERLQKYITGIDQTIDLHKESSTIEKSSITKESNLTNTRSGLPEEIKTKVEKIYPEREKIKNSESLRVSSEKLDEVLNTASEIFIGRIRFQNEITTIQGFIKSFKTSVDKASDFQKSKIMAKIELYIPEVSKDLKKLIHGKKHTNRIIDSFLNKIFNEMVSRIIPESSSIEMSLHEELNLNYLTIEEIQKQLQKNLESLEQLSTRLQNGAMSFRMVPISNLFEKFPIQIRDLARTVGKKVRVNIIGGDTELDKVLINKIGDPLIHMLRNSIDHGIESPEERLKLGKPEVGTIILKTYYHGSFAVIEIRDDGKGIDADKLLSKALEKELITEAQKLKLNGNEILDLVFLPGFSTNERVTELSGRGVGMDVVRTAINQLHGTIEIESQVGKGTCFKLKLPLTLAIVKILLVQESSYQFALPILNIETLITANKKDIILIDNRLIYNYKGQTINVTSLSTILDFPQSKFKTDKIPMVILNENNKLTGILVDSVLGRQEILIKNLGRFLTKVPFVMGCTILRDSRLVLILDPRQIAEGVKMAGNFQKEVLESKQTNDNSNVILVVDDSALQRENLKAILKNSDYLVETAENGFDALKASRSKTYSAFFVDIMMPLMDGYEFVERLRKIPIYKEVPIILISTKDIDQARISKLNITNVFQKPVDGDKLISILKERLMEVS